MVFDTLESKYPDISHFGMFHIRRGDAIGECDTTLRKISNYLSCSLDRIEMYGNISIMLSTDEHDPCYRNAIQGMIEALGFRFVDLDAVVAEVVTDYATLIPNGSRLVNNMFIYKVEANMEWHERIGFRMNQRRSQSCNSCDELHSSWQFQKKPIISEPHHNWTIDFTHVNETYTICANKLSAESVE
mmetsp:Transcript_18979/g.34232  ORF Transcript_18979/g.34232 Transcript_18979/m.34232 type:complete len:187 (-) Transcript_18979:259-819(-)